jgi:hypothetical protein
MTNRVSDVTEDVRNAGPRRAGVSRNAGTDPNCSNTFTLPGQGMSAQAL